MTGQRSKTSGTITLETVAKHAGVSMKTVSRVVNNEPFVSEKMRAKVLQAIKDLDFIPNMAARQLRGQRSYSLALVYEPPSSEFLTEILEGVLPVCRAAAYKLLLEPLTATESRRHIFKMIDERVADGFILLPPLSEDISLIKRINAAGLEVVLVASTLNTERLGLRVSKVGVDDFAAGREMGRYFIDRGHTRIGYVSLREQHTMANQRGEGLKAAMAEAGIPESEFLFASGESSFESGVSAGRELLARDAPPTAIFAGNDYMAAGVIACAKEMGLDIPDDISIAGFDGADLSAMFVPPFMTVEQPMRDYGRWAVNQILSAIADEKREQHDDLLDYHLVPRGSVKIRPL